MDAIFTGLVQASPNVQSIFLAVVLVILVIFGGYFKFKFSYLHGKKLPPGSLGFPFIGETISFLRAQKQDKNWEWVESRVAKYGPVFKTSILGSPVVHIIGQAGNKFIFNAKDDTIRSNQPAMVVSILGKHSIFELVGNRHKLVRGGMLTFLRPESLQRNVGEMGSLVKQHLLQEFDGKDSVRAVPLIKKITFKITSSLLFGLSGGKEEDSLYEDFSIALRGLWALPLNFPMTGFYRGLKARQRICRYFSMLIQRKKKEMEQGKLGVQDDVISCFLNLRDENGEKVSEEEIIDNIITLMIASHDTTAILLCLLMRLLARDATVCRNIHEEQKKILMEKVGSDDGKLTWGDIQKMKYTWRVAQELMRLTPPVFGGFRNAAKDIAFGGFDIPKGWEVFWVASATHMDKNIFDDPEKFDPSRFDDSLKNFAPYTYVPFGGGPRMCPGNEFARIEVLLIIHHLITNYHWSMMIPDEPISRQPLPYPAMGLPIKLEPRRNL